MPTTLDRVRADDRFDILSKLIDRAVPPPGMPSIDQLLSGDPAFVLAAPTDAAFAALARDQGHDGNPDTREAYLNALFELLALREDIPTGTLIHGLLSYHLFLPDQDEAEIFTVLGATVTRDPTTGALRDRAPTTPDARPDQGVVTDNGVLGPIDAVLFPDPIVDAGGDVVIRLDDADYQLLQTRAAGATAGAKLIATAAGDDTVFGGLGNDVIVTGAGADLVAAGAGDDTVATGGGFDTVLAWDGDDVIRLGTGRANAYGGQGDDTVFAEGAKATIGGGDGNDVLIGGTAAVSLIGGDGNDVLRSGTEGGQLWGGEGRDTLDGGDGDDGLIGNDGDDLIGGGGGDDLILGGAGADTILGGDGDDRIFAGPGADPLDGPGAGDAIDGGTGDDLIVGGLGDDTIRTGLGTDTIVGGAGADLFDFVQSAAAARTIIRDFDPGIDSIRIDGDGLEPFLAMPEGEDTRITFVPMGPDNALSVRFVTPQGTVIELEGVGPADLDGFLL